MGVYREDSVVPFETFRYVTNKASFEYDVWKQIEAFVDDVSQQVPERVNGFAYSSVVPEINSVYDELALNRFGVRALCISHKSPLSIRIMYTNPSLLGVDRIVNAEAVHHEYGGDNIINRYRDCGHYMCAHG